MILRRYILFFLICAFQASIMYAGPVIPERKEKITFVSRLNYLSRGSYRLGLSIAQLGSASTIGYFIGKALREEMNKSSYSRLMCSIVGVIGLATVPTLLTAAWKNGKEGIQALRRAFAHIKKFDAATSETPQPPVTK